MAFSFSSSALSTGGFSIEGRLTNERGVIRKLGKYDRDAATQIRSDIKQMASPIEGRARQIAGRRQPVLSGWTKSWGRAKWVESSVMSGYTVTLGRSGMRTQSGEKLIPLLVLKNRNAAGSIYDWAGRANPKNRLAASLDGVGLGFGYMKGSQYSRVLFPAYVAEKGSVQRNINRALDKVAQRFNKAVGN